MARLTLEQRYAKAQERADDLQSQLKTQARKRRTGRLIALGVVLQKILLARMLPVQDIQGAVNDMLGDRQRALASEELQDIAKKLAEMAPESTKSKKEEQ